MSLFCKIYSLDTRSAELFASALAITFGGWLLAPWQTYSAAPTFQYLSVWGPEWAFGLIMLLIGVTQYGGILFSLMPNKCHWILRIIGNNVGVVGWSILAISFWLSNPTSTAAIVYTVVVLICIYISIKLSIESGKIGHSIWKLR